MSDDGLTQSIDKLRREGVGEAAVESFRRYYERLREGDRGVLAEDDIEPVEDLPDADALPEPGADVDAALDATVVIKLNGGLGTSMGMSGPKSLVAVRDGLSFLDVIVRQVLHLRRRSGARLPLVLMNSFATRAPSLAALARYGDLAADGPLDFVQNKVPKLAADDLTPVDWPADRGLEWAPPGHGDLYTALVTSGLLDDLRARSYRYAFVSNADNLGAVLDPRILAWFARDGLPFVMEVADRTEADRKGGHVARRREGGLVLREVAQTREEDLDAFQDIKRHRYFNTNTLWIDLVALTDTLQRQGGVLELPMIVNAKTVDPSDASSPAVIQLETAMGAAIDVFDGAQALRVPRSRFAPVKTTSDLLVLRSDAYVLTDDGRIVLADERHGRAPVVDLDPAHFKLLDDFETRFAFGAPSLIGCERLRVMGDVAFGAYVVVRGSVIVEHHGPKQRRVEDGTILAG